MKKIITIHQKNMQTNEEICLYDSICDYYENLTSFSFTYKEKKPYDGLVEMKGNNQECMLIRKSEHVTKLHFIKNKKSEAFLSTPYGDMKLEIQTKHYIRKEDLLAIEYEIINDNIVIEHYRIMIKIKKVM